MSVTFTDLELHSIVERLDRIRFAAVFGGGKGVARRIDALILDLRTKSDIRLAEVDGDDEGEPAPAHRPRLRLLGGTEAD